MKIFSGILSFTGKAFGFILMASLKLLMFTISISFAIAKFIISIVLLILSVGAFASSSHKF